MKIKSHFFALTTIFILSFQVSAQNISPGDIIISEIMQNPKSVSDTKGEWFEILNNTIYGNIGDATPVNIYVALTDSTISGNHIYGSGSDLFGMYLCS